MKARVVLLLLPLGILAGLTASAQVADSSLLTIDRIFGSREFGGRGGGTGKWIEGGAAYARLERSEDIPGGKDIVRYDTKSGAKRVLVPATRLIPKDGSMPLSIQGYDFSSDGKRLLVYTNSRKVWRLNTRGDYWVLDLQTWALKKLGGDIEPSTMMFAKFSPDGARVGYVHLNNIYVEDLATDRITQLTQYGSPTLINGTTDWVYEEEFFLRDAWRWSPDGEWIAYWQLNSEKVKTFYLINNTDSLYSYCIPIRYPKAGTTNSSCRIGVVNAEGGETSWMNVPGDPSNTYIPRMEWADNSDEIVLQHLNRLQNTDDLLIADARSGLVRTILTERDKAWVEVVNDLHWLDGGREFTWVSERDGWKHVYVVSRTGKEQRLITPGAYDVIKVLEVDEKEGWLYYLASPDDPTQRYLYRARLNGKGSPELVTPAGHPGTHSYQISPDARWAFHTFSTFTAPPFTDLISLPDHRVVRVISDNTAMLAKIKSLKRPSVQFLRFDNGEGVKLDAYIMKPWNFDSTKRYPVFFNVYGEPAGQTVADRWERGELWHMMLTQEGYIVMSVDNRGTASPRGHDWRRCIYKKIGILASADQAAVVREIRKWPFVDSTRIGIWGWSGGGSMTLNMMLRYPSLYTTGIAVASVPNLRYYDSIYQERYMGLPEDDPDAYRICSPITYADSLRGNLLIIHGSGDDNVHYQGAEALINALIAANKHFLMMEYPNRTHSISEGKNTTRHLYELMTWYLNTYLPAGPR